MNIRNIVKTTRSVLRSVDDLRTFVTEYDYDSLGKMKTLTYPDNEKVTYSYDEAGQLTAINGKELDTETGLAYYGVRYYFPELSVWYGVDPLMEKYPQNGAYVFCNANPVRFVDLDGRKFTESSEKIVKDFKEHF